MLQATAEAYGPNCYPYATVVVAVVAAVVVVAVVVAVVALVVALIAIDKSSACDVSTLILL